MTAHRIPAAAAGRDGPRWAELDELARAEQAMADGCPSVDQELLLMSVGSKAHLARRHRSIARPRRHGPLVRWLRRFRVAR
ncbi:hypothetical protein [Kutzneria sp. CA-103260]|uniref:hypothetical protein n=1 Tax=Kutzneria sp. CA-103260 TaxID=2802641 RepID=UPI001BAB8CA9|nr:hypothetical protein [Kutzneria sp. CA-103260]QUQ64027.1 hypothetical protein JJ691_17470 [Kutzneria sp. CA-103260]